MVVTPPPMRTSRPSAAAFAVFSAECGVAPTKWDVVSLSVNDGRTRAS
ncbi:hypothetical protein EV191_11083 [Tamaricihabitans halophyticus]|uniref:Uncharacterized protein n=1 Tax=Tamaricihabitans halophyticus TaxID=1262583 RepID=A0A4V2ST13_9PSEU|nr:hypothetical protein EV191_11083 [Tamaricihabitans halophyticus]